MFTMSSLLFRRGINPAQFSRFYGTERALKVVKPGAVIKINGAPYIVNKIQLGKRGKGGGFVKAKLQNALTGTGSERTFTSDEDVEEIALERIKAHYSWKDEDTFMFMHAETFEEIAIPQSRVETPAFLVEGDEYQVQRLEGKYIGVIFPYTATYTVMSLERTGGTGMNAQKATLNTGAVIDVPEFINTGDVVKVNMVEGGVYSSRE